MEVIIPDLEVHPQFNCFLSAFEFRKFISLLGSCHSLNKKKESLFSSLEKHFVLQKNSSEIPGITCLTLEGHESIIFEDCPAEMWQGLSFISRCLGRHRIVVK